MYSAAEMAALQQFEQEADERIQCKYCGRKFNEEPFKRHEPICANKAREAQIKKKMRR